MISQLNCNIIKIIKKKKLIKIKLIFLMNKKTIKIKDPLLFLKFQLLYFQHLLYMIFFHDYGGRSFYSIRL